MELIPTLKLGLLNGWIFLALFYLIFGIFLLIFPKDVVARLYDFDRSRWDKRQKVFDAIRRLLGFVSLVLIIFTPIKTGTTVFIPGVVLFGLGLIGFMAALIDFKNRPLDQPAVRGLYRISRNPQIFMLFVLVFGISMAIGSWLVLFLEILTSVFGHARTLAEEKACLARYGDLYSVYMKRVPRYFLFF
ncbi:MAG: hypothetical protein JXB15_09100 [Anaerolineales bacterium]|nr:hypothetical protein [Anaerolineales bacterium]